MGLAKDETMTTNFAHGVRPGDRVKMHFDTNRIRRRVVDAGNETQFEIITHIRPSKGFARHIRRMKAKR